RNAAVGGTQAGNAATHAGRDDAATGFAADREADEPGRSGGAGAGAGAGSTFFQKPRIHGLAAEPYVVEGKGAQAQFGHQHGAGLVQAAHDGRIGGRNAAAEGLGAVGGGNALSVEQVFAAPGDSVQRAAILAGGDLAVGPLRLLQSEIAGQSDHAT